MDRTTEGDNDDPVRIGLICDRAMHERCMNEASRRALACHGEVAWLETEAPSSFEGPPPEDPDVEDAVAGFGADKRIIVIGPGAPRFHGRLLDRLPKLTFIGELEGDRFAHRVDLDETRKRGITVVDTTNGSSYPVSEWALALMMIGLRGASELYRNMADGIVMERDWLDAHVSFRVGELTGRRVGLIGCGHIGRRLLELLAPFRTVNHAYDPFIPPAVAELLDLRMVGLADLFARSEVVVCTLPLTPRTEGLIGAEHFALLKPDSVFVNVSRGGVVDTDAMIARLRAGDVWAGLDVLEPENPVPPDHPIRSMPNVFVTPHIAGVTAACGPRFVTLMADEIGRYLAGEATRFDLVARNATAPSGSRSRT